MAPENADTPQDRESANRCAVSFLSALSFLARCRSPLGECVMTPLDATCPLNGCDHRVESPELFFLQTHRGDSAVNMSDIAPAVFCLSLPDSRKHDPRASRRRRSQAQARQAKTPTTRSPHPEGKCAGEMQHSANYTKSPASTAKYASRLDTFPRRSFHRLHNPLVVTAVFKGCMVGSLPNVGRGACGWGSRWGWCAYPRTGPGSYRRLLSVSTPYHFDAYTSSRCLKHRKNAVC